MAVRPRKNRYQAIERTAQQTGDIIALAENIELLTGQRGDGLERAITWRDAADAGLINLIGRNGGYSGFIPGTGTGGSGSNYSTTAETPSKPTGVTASGAFTAIYIQWDMPVYRGHSFAEIWRASTDNFGAAVRIGTEAGNIFADPVGMGAAYFYWVRFRNINDDVGPLHATNGVQAATAPNIGEIMDQLGETLNESALSSSLNSRIALIDSPATGLIDRLNAEIAARQTADGQLQVQIESIVLSSIADVYYQPDMPTGSINEDSRWFDTDDGNRPYLYKSGAWVDTSDQRIVDLTAAVATEQSARITADTAQAEKIAALETTVFNPFTGVSASASAITSLQSSVSSLNGQTTANTTEISQIQAIVGNDYATLQTVRDVTIGSGGLSAQYYVKTDVNGRIAGYGLYNTGATSQFIVLADTFALAHPSAPTKYPFIIDGGQTYIDMLMVKDGAITNAKIQSLTADKITAGIIDAARIGANSITADKIDSRGLTIKDSSGNIIFGSGNNLDWSRVSGQPANIFNSNISIGANGVLTGAGGGQVTLGGMGAGWLAYVNQITPANAWTYIQAAAIPRALIGALNVGTADIVDANVTTLKLAGNSVSVVGAVENTNAPLTASVYVSASDLPPGSSTVPIVVTASRHQGSTVYFTLKHNGVITFNGTPPNGIHSMTKVYNCSVGWNTFSLEDAGGGYPTTIYQQTLTYTLGKR